MEFGDDDDEHEEEEEQEEGDQEEDDDDDDEEGITIPPPPPPPPGPPLQQPSQTHDFITTPTIPITNHNHQQSLRKPPPLTLTTTISTPTHTPIPNTNTNTNSAAATTTTPRYRECLKNHAVSMGGHAVDGCGEYMPSGEDGILEALKCAACGCHRNFHRKESDVVLVVSHSPATASTPQPLYPPHHQFTPSSSPYYRTPPPPQPLPPPQPQPFQVVVPQQQPPHTTTAASGHHHHHHYHRPLALPSSRDQYTHQREMDEFSNPSSSGGGGIRRVGASGSGSGGGEKSKRFRTKFTAEQKERMFEFAERVGWRLQKHDEAAVQQFCQDVGVRRQVLKVWMHNNKNTLGNTSSSRRSTA